MRKNLKLEPILPDLDKTKEVYSSSECQNIIQMWEEYYPKIGYHFPWVGYFVFYDDKIVGCCGFTGKPQNGRVELSYGTFKEFEGKGISTFSCREMIAIVKTTDPKLKIIAKTAPEENASVSILKKNGFEFSRIVQDHEIGDAWEWLLKK